MSYGFGDWNYWHFFVISVNYYSSHSILTAEASLARSTTDYCESESEPESYVTTDGQTASLSWNKTPIWGLRPDFYYY
jgi:hypothetical protein